MGSLQVVELLCIGPSDINKIDASTALVSYSCIKQHYMVSGVQELKASEFVFRIILTVFYYLSRDSFLF